MTIRIAEARNARKSNYLTCVGQSDATEAEDLNGGSPGKDPVLAERCLLNGGKTGRCMVELACRIASGIRKQGRTHNMPRRPRLRKVCELIDAANNRVVGM
jgi:hypothetical protein